MLVPAQQNPVAYMLQHYLRTPHGVAAWCQTHAHAPRYASVVCAAMDGRRGNRGQAALKPICAAFAVIPPVALSLAVIETAHFVLETKQARMPRWLAAVAPYVPNAAVSMMALCSGEILGLVPAAVMSSVLYVVGTWIADRRWKQPVLRHYIHSIGDPAAWLVGLEASQQRGMLEGLRVYCRAQSEQIDRLLPKLRAQQCILQGGSAPVEAAVASSLVPIECALALTVGQANSVADAERAVADAEQRLVFSTQALQGIELMLSAQNKG